MTPMPLRTLSLMLALAALAASPALAFDAGSNGSYGAIAVPAGQTQTITMPADGVFHCTTVDVGGGATLRFIPNAQNTPVRILAQGAVIINGTIDVNGQSSSNAVPGVGGPGGFDGGAAGDTFMGQPPGAGKGPGGGAGGDPCCTDESYGRGAFGCPVPSARARDGVQYGNALLLDLIGGSGGGGSVNGFGGGGGGGAILIASNVSIAHSGYILAEGGFSAAGAGSGGAIRLVAPVVSGTGALNTRPGNWTHGATTNGSAGRARVDALNRTSANFQVYAPCSYTAGNVMVLSAPGIGTLRVVLAAGEPISENTTDAVLIQLQPGSSPTQNVTVRARGYTGSVPIEVVLTPERGSRVVTQATINVTGDPTDLVVPVTFPINMPTRVDVWTR